MLKPFVLPLPASVMPDEVFARVSSCAYPVWLDSAQGQFGSRGRYSFIAAEPFAWIKVVDGRCRLWEGGCESAAPSDVFTLLDRLTTRYAQADEPLLPPFQGGAAGFLGYELGRFLERVPTASRNDWGIPEAYVGWYNTVFAWDHFLGAGYVVVSPHPEGTQEAAERRAQDWVTRVAVGPPWHGEAPKSFTPFVGEEAAVGGRKTPFALRGTFDRAGYCRSVVRIKEAIAAGDIYQANLSQRFEASWEAEPEVLYRHLRIVSPAPFGAYIGLPEGAVLSNSPERFLRVKDGVAETCPIKGTRRRGRTAEQDEACADALRASDKDRAEHVMIVDLERNDLGRVCEFGSVRPTAMMSLESYANVHHLVSTVQGRVRRECSATDVLRALFPGGSITGAPKIRAMQVIAELEPTWRGVYTGSVGYQAFSGAMDWSIAIRTMVCEPGRLRFQVGGGIVADSDPEAEYEETLHKAAAMQRVLGLGGTDAVDGRIWLSAEARDR